MPTLLDQPPQAIWAICIHARPVSLDSNFDDDLQQHTAYTTFLRVCAGQPVKMSQLKQLLSYRNRAALRRSQAENLPLC